MADPVDFSQTQRVVLLLDLNPLLNLQNPSLYLSSILTTTQILLTFPSLSTSLFAFKLFFSSVSPLRSSSALHRLHPVSSPSSLCFNYPPETLSSLFTTLNSLSISSISAELASLPPRALHTASSLLQLAHGYAWESHNENPPGTWNNFPVVRSNLIILLSPMHGSLRSLSEFMNVDIKDESLTQVDAFCKRFHHVFGAVNDAYVNRDIHCSWIDVKYETDCNLVKSIRDDSTLQLGLFEEGIRSLGWGFCSTDSIVLGSVLIPFGLIYPKIGIPLNFINCNNFVRSLHAKLVLEISDVNGKPLECKCCNVELLNLNMLPRLRSDAIMNCLDFRNSKSEGVDQNETFWDHLGDGTIMLHVKAVQHYAKGDKIEGCSSEHILVRGFSSETGKSRKKCSSSLFTDRVLETLSSEMGEFIRRETVPIWQILLGFLYRKGYWALVSLLNSSGNSCLGILKPFTAHMAFLDIIDNRHATVHDSGGFTVAKIESEISKHFVDKNANRLIDSQIWISSSQKNMPLDDKEREKKKKLLQQDLSWSSFCKAAFEGAKLDLEEVYFSSKSNDSKKLKFLKCWVKQIDKASDYCRATPVVSKLCQHIVKEIDERLTCRHQESEKPISAHSSTGPSGIEEGTALASCSETFESFFHELPKKIRQGLESEGVDLRILAERLVTLSIHWLYQKFETGMECPTLGEKSNHSCGKAVATELIKLLLREPKQLKDVDNSGDSSVQASDARSTSLLSENRVREYELQILLRMEIFYSEVAESIEKSVKRKLLKHICSLLEIIQYLVEGGFHGHMSLYDYVERTIKARYSHTLGDVVKRIYEEMDLLPFGDEDESPNFLLNSEDSNNSLREKPLRDKRCEANKNQESVSAEGESSQAMDSNDESQQAEKQEDHARKLSEARKRRERARRFVSFTSKVPELRRVWAPKQPKTVKAKTDSLLKQPKRREPRKATYDVVCETPLTVKQHSCSQDSYTDDDERQDRGSNCHSVSKALFQDHIVM